MDHVGIRVKLSSDHNLPSPHLTWSQLVWCDLISSCSDWSQPLT